MQISFYMDQNFRSAKDSRSAKLFEKDAELSRILAYSLENYEKIEYESSNSSSWNNPKFSWLFVNASSNISMRNRNVLLDSSGKEYIQIDSLFIDFGDR